MSSINAGPRAGRLEIDVRIRRDRDKSIGIASPHAAGDIVFLPLSLIEVVSHDVPSGRARIKIPRWLIVEKGLEALVDDESDDAAQARSS